MGISTRQDHGPRAGDPTTAITHAFTDPGIETRGTTGRRNTVTVDTEGIVNSFYFLTLSPYSIIIRVE